MRDGQPNSRQVPIGEDVITERAQNYVRAARDTAYAEQIARLLIGYRIEHSLTQEQLAELVDLSVSKISKLENAGHPPNGTTMAQILACLNKRMIFVDNETKS